jgi:hypothetical protein
MCRTSKPNTKEMTADSRQQTTKGGPDNWDQSLEDEANDE